MAPVLQQRSYSMSTSGSRKQHEAVERKLSEQVTSAANGAAARAALIRSRSSDTGPGSPVDRRASSGRKNGHSHMFYTLPRRISPPPVFDIVGKVMLIGDSAVGKTCLLIRFKDGCFLSGNFISTVGIDFRNKIVTVDDCKVKLQIWDTAGQERFRSVTHAYYRDAHALLLLYDVTSKTSFDNTRAWLAEIREYAQEDVVIMLLGNKADATDRIIKREDGERLAKEYRVAFMETSAKTGMNVELAFMAVARELKYNGQFGRGDSSFNVAEYVRSQSVKPGCSSCNSS